MNTKARGWWYPYIFVGMFAVVIAVNGALFYFATSTFSGLQTERSYDLGIGYNRVLAQAEAQAKLGWKVEMRLIPPAQRGAEAELIVEVIDSNGQSVTDLVAEIVLDRPAQAGFRQVAALSEVAAGRYGARVLLPLAGQWDGQVVLKRGDEVLYQKAQRFMVP